MTAGKDDLQRGLQEKVIYGVTGTADAARSLDVAGRLLTDKMTALMCERYWTSA